MWFYALEVCQGIHCERPYRKDYSESWRIIEPVMCHFSFAHKRIAGKYCAKQIYTYALPRWQSNIFWLMGHASTWTSDRIPMNGFQSRASSFRRTFLFRSRPRSLYPASFSLCHRNSFSADLDGQASYANCRFFLAGKPALANGSTGVVVVGHGKLLFERESEGGRKREKEREVERERVKRRERGRVGERGWTRSSASGRESISSPRKNATPPTASLRRLDPLFGIADFFFFLSPSFFHSNTSTTVIALSKQSLSPSSRQTL